MTGAVQFRDDFGEPRSGHAHQGIDIFAPRGRTNVAVADGTVVRLNDPTGGGNTIWLTTPAGDTFVYMHLQGYVGTFPRGVTAGDVIATTDDTGNAVGTHTHFEIHPDSSAAINPYGTLLQACPNRV